MIRMSRQQRIDHQRTASAWIDKKGADVTRWATLDGSLYPIILDSFHVFPFLKLQLVRGPPNRS